MFKLKMTTPNTVYINANDYVFVSDPFNKHLYNVRFYYVEQGNSTVQVGKFPLNSNTIDWHMLSGWSNEKQAIIKQAAEMIWNQESKRRSDEVSKAKLLPTFKLSLNKEGAACYINDNDYVFATALGNIDIRDVRFFYAQSGSPVIQVAWFEASEILRWQFQQEWTRDHMYAVKHAVEMILNFEMSKRKEKAKETVKKIIEKTKIKAVVSKAGKTLKFNPKYVVFGQTVYWSIAKKSVDGQKIYYKCKVAAVAGSMVRIKSEKYKVDKWVDVRDLAVE